MLFYFLLFVFFPFEREDFGLFFPFEREIFGINVTFEREILYICGEISELL